MATPEDRAVLPRQSLFLGRVEQRELRCDKCLNYLSVGPVAITANRETLCGRCSGAVEGQVRLAKSLVNLVARECLFRCVNHYDGCDAMLAFDEVAAHEVSCPGREYNCLFCSYKATNGSQIVSHYEKTHPEKVIQKNTFRFPQEQDENELHMIYYDDNNILALKMFMNKVFKISAYYFNQRSKDSQFRIGFNRNNCSLTFDIDLTEYGIDEKPLTIYTEELKYYLCNLDEISCRVELKNKSVESDGSDDNRELLLQKQLWQAERAYRERVTLLQEQLQKEPKIFRFQGDKLKDLEGPCVENRGNLTPRKDNGLLKKKYLEENKDLECARCKTRISSGILYLYDGSSVCEKCMKDALAWAEFEHLESTITCACDEVVTVLDYNNHKRVCQLRTYKCVVSGCMFRSTSSQLLKHWHQHYPLVSGNSVGLECKNNSFYWLADSELFLVNFTCSQQHSIYNNKNLNINIMEIEVTQGYKYVMHFKYQDNANIPQNVPLTGNKTGRSLAISYSGNLKDLMLTIN